MSEQERVRITDSTGPKLRVYERRDRTFSLYLPEDVESALRMVLDKAGLTSEAMVVRGWLAEQDRESSTPFVDPYHPYRLVRRVPTERIVEG